MARRLVETLKFLEWPLRGRQQRVMLDRATYSKDEFTRSFSSQGVAEEIINEVWDALVQVAVIDEFKPHPEDDLQYVFGLAEEDLDEDVILVLLQRCGCRVPTPAEVKTMGPVNSVANLVEFISAMRT